MEQSKYIHPVNIIRLNCLAFVADVLYSQNDFIAAWDYFKPLMEEQIPAFILPYNRCSVATFVKFECAFRSAHEATRELWQPEKVPQAFKTLDESKKLLAFARPYYISMYGTEDEGGVLRQTGIWEENFKSLDKGMARAATASLHIVIQKNPGVLKYNWGRTSAISESVYFQQYFYTHSYIRLFNERAIPFSQFVSTKKFFQTFPVRQTPGLKSARLFEQD
ncbi:hypothetical protein RvY_05870 [Ramazzottius varieornatus]|uniref:Uncharacterized protein n=1 Tax=Ramazzottius varieornatus TaxID=947166 RepID=A0A1D1V237_RAMVA|nr:hypothetical protein RvY_05870 [Ramazzottius varieornatus]